MSWPGLRRRRRLDELGERSNSAILAQDEDVETNRHDRAAASGPHLPEELDQVMVRVGVAGRLEDVRLRGHPFLLCARDARIDLVETTGCSLRRVVLGILREETLDDCATSPR